MVYTDEDRVRCGSAVKEFQEMRIYYHTRGKDDIAELFEEAIESTKEFYGQVIRGSGKSKKTIRWHI